MKFKKNAEHYTDFFLLRQKNNELQQLNQIKGGQKDINFIDNVNIIDYPARFYSTIF